MIQLESGNVLLKPLHRKQMMARLKRVIRIGERVGKFVMRITLHRVGHHIEMVARVRDRVGEFVVRHRDNNLNHTLHRLVADIVGQLHAHRRPVALTS